MNSHALAGRSDLHIIRKLWHLLWGTSGLIAYFYFSMSVVSWGWICLAICLCGFTIDFLRFKKPAFNKQVIRVFGPIMRESELTSFSGLPFYALGISAAAFFYNENIALISICFLIYADPIASFFGVLFGKEMILPNKSLVGTLANFLTCYIITLVFILPLDISVIDMLIFATCGAIIGSVSELLSAFNIDDNLTIPMISGGALTIVNIFLKLF